MYKNIKRLSLVLSSTVVLLAGCNEDVLEKGPEDQLSTENFWENETNAQSAVDAAYSQFNGGFWSHTEVNFVMENFRSDFVTAGGDVLANYPDQEAFSIYNVVDNNGRMQNYWDKQYIGVSMSSLVVENVAEMTSDQIDADRKAEIVAEGKFLRALYHMRILMNWEDIVVFDFVPQTPDELYQPLTPRDQAWASIEKDFSEAAQDLPVSWDNNNRGRGTSGAALGFLGKAQLQQGKYTEAAATLADVMALEATAGYDLAADYQSLFDGSNELSAESLFEIAFTPNEAAGNDVQYAGMLNIAAGEMGGWEAMLPTQKLLTEMQSEGRSSTDINKYDARLYATIYFNDIDVDIYGFTYEEVFGIGATKVGWKKYLLRNESPWATSFWGVINQPLLRYADVILMRAEALNESSGTAAAIPFINRVRTRALMPNTTATTQAEVRDAIMHERAMEFALEGSRFYDLRRYGAATMTSEIQSSDKPGTGNFDASADSFLPVPSSEVLANPNIN